MLERIFLIACVVLWLPYGVMCFLDPALLAESAGISAITAAGTTELRAMYGGLQASIGVFALLAVFRADLVRPFLVALAIMSAGLLLTRTIGLFMDGNFTGYTGMALSFETVMLGASAMLLNRRRHI